MSNSEGGRGTKEKSQNEALLMRPGVTSICRLLKYGAERFSGRSEVVSSAPAEPCSLDVNVRLQGDRPPLALCDCMGDFFGSLK